MVTEDELKGKVEKYRKLTEQALKEVKLMEDLDVGHKKVADDFLEMCKNYLSDGKHFEEKGELLTALASFSYAHAWLDAGVRAGIFKAENRELFTLK